VQFCDIIFADEKLKLLLLGFYFFKSNYTTFFWKAYILGTFFTFS